MAAKVLREFSDKKAARGVHMNERRIIDYISNQAVRNPDRPAICLSTNKSINYKQLAEQINKLSRQLYELGFELNRRIAIAMPHGPEAIIAFYAVASITTVVPLNPNCLVTELKNYMMLAKVDAIIVKEGYSAAVAQAAAETGIPVIIMDTNGEGEFHFRVVGPVSQKVDNIGHQENDIAVVLFTSGTTSTPKVVPVTHANLIKTVDITTEIFGLKEEDRCISVTPLFHIYGIVGPLLSAAATGSSVICLPSFNPQEFFRILRELQITWYAASPAIHHAVAEYAERIGVDKANYALQLIRSGSAPLPVKVVEKLKKYFGAIVVQGYGLTETAGLGTCNPPIPGKIKNESVGLVTGCEIGIIDEQKNFLPQTMVGQIVIRGESITKGYENVDDNSQIFLENGWFATGDQGYFDEDGHLFITGRIKEMINRGGVKISPYEVEEVLGRHEDVIEAAVFAAPHPYLGEIPMALAVLRPSSLLTAENLKNFLRDKISLSKMPVQIFLTAQIPKSANGKIQRRLLYRYIQNHPEDFPAALLEVATEEAEFNTATEKALADIWRELLKIEHVSNADDFFEVGGDSLMAEMLFAEIERVLAIKLPADTILAHRTLQELAALIDRENPTAKEFDFIVPINPFGSRQPLFCIHNVGGDVLTYRKLADYLDKDLPVYGLSLNLEAKNLQHPVRIVDLAAFYIQEMRAVQPNGPYFVAGHSLGGLLAYEISRQLQAQNQEIALLAMLDTRLLNKKHRKPLWKKLKHNYQKLSFVPFRQIFHYLKQKTLDEIERFKVKRFMRTYPAPLDHTLNKAALKKNLLQYAGRHYKPESYQGIITYFNAKQESKNYAEETLKGWSELADRVQVVDIDATHSTIVTEPAVRELACKLEEALKTSTQKI